MVLPHATSSIGWHQLAQLIELCQSASRDEQAQYQPRIALAYDEMKYRLQPVDHARIKQIISRLFMHFPPPPNISLPSLMLEYCEALQSYPEDLLCAAYQHVVMHYKHPSLPRAEQLVAIMEPELIYRRAMLHRLENTLLQLPIIEAFA